HQHYCTVMPVDELVTRFYVRFLCRDVPGVIGHIGTSFGKHQVSLESIVQIGFQNELAEIVVVTHDVREGNFRQALQEIRMTSAIDSIPSILRVL
ncbi:MAG: ACT domain-containing protein, partial [Xenococcaceae cyanobacterium]